MYKRWFLEFGIVVLCFLAVFLITGIMVDPYFHYHKPLAWLQYKIDEERYQNDGIVKHFDYDAIITGSSMTQNFYPSEMDVLFGVHSVKVPYSGATYREVNENLERAFQVNDHIKMVVRGLDYNMIGDDASKMKYDSYPTYLYNAFLSDDVNYVFNKQIFIEGTIENVIIYTREGNKTTTFDEYHNWNKDYSFGKEAILENYSRSEKVAEKIQTPFNSSNIKQNAVEIAIDNPDCEFYYFFTPYSILFFDSLNQQGRLKNQLQWEKEAIECLLACRNIHLYSFFDEPDIITNLENYKDTAHYGEQINSYILQCMKNHEHELTKNNYEDYCQREWDFFTTYDYDSIYE